MSSLRELIEERVGSELAAALEGRGFEALTPVQEAVLKPELEGRDLRISSQTGSGKTIAIGLALRDSLEATQAASDGNEKGVDQRAHPRAIVVVPTRELAKQVQEELAWLYAGLPDVRIAAVTGGGGYRDELRAFRAKPAIIVGTPGRLLDHLNRGSIQPSDARSFVLDEADRMLDLGFREDIEAIFGFAPEERRTLLVSATFPREVKALADRLQNDPVSVQGTPLGGANEDIEHLLHLVHQEERLAAIINLLLEANGQTLIFARTRADVAELTGLLQDAGFSVTSLSGEMEQAERNRALTAFKRGNIDALVATDVAARGIDVNDVTRVIHAEPPTDADAYTHRSGRTGRAGKKGVSSVLVTPREIQRTTALLGRARVKFRFAPLPTAESLRDARDTALFERLTADFVEGDAIDERSLALAERVLNAPEATRAVGRLISDALRQQTEAREITVITAPEDRKREPRAPNRDGWVRFRVSWGTAYGADHRRLMAMLCRRGKIEGRDVGAINLGRTSSVVEVSARVAEAFERATAKPDPRDPKIHVRRWSDDPTRGPGDDAPHAPPPPRSRRAVADASEPAALPPVPADRPSRAAKKSDRELPVPPPSAPKSRRTLAEAPASEERVVAAPKSKRALPEAPASDRVVAAPKSKRALPEAAASERVVAAPKSKRALPDAPASDRVVAAPKSKRALPDAPASDRAAVAVPADRPSRAAKKSERDIAASPASVPNADGASAKRKKKAGREEVPFTPREAVIRREPKPARGDHPAPHAPNDRGARDDRRPPSHDRGGKPPWKKSGPPNAGGPRNDRARDDRPRDDRPRDDRPRDDRAGTPPWKKSGPPNAGGPRNDRPRDDRPRDDRPAPRGPRRDGPPPWERRGGGNGPPKRRGGPRPR